MQDLGSNVDVSPHWTSVVQGIRDEHAEAAGELYRALRGFKTFFARKLGSEEVEDRYHDLIVAILSAIRQGSIREPERLAGYAATTARYMVFERIRAAARRRRDGEFISWSMDTSVGAVAEADAIRREAREIARRVLDTMSERYRAVLVRFYIEEDDAGRICSEMNLTADQFRLIKSRAKAQFSMLMQRRIGPISIVRHALRARVGAE